MSLFSGYDSEAIGFDSVSKNDKTETATSSQTPDYASSSVGTQATMSQSFGTQSNADTIPQNVTTDYASLNVFLKRVVPTMLEALDTSVHDFPHNSPDSDDEEAVHADLFQILEYSEICDETARFSGGGDRADKKNPSVLSMSWSSAGNTLAVSLGHSYHDDWCEHDGIIRVYTAKRSAGDKLTHFYDITHNNCITVIQYHPGIAALLAYATTAGEVVVRSLRNATEAGLGDGAFLVSPPGSHGSRRVSSIQWADRKLTMNLLMLQAAGAGKRRGASDQVLISAGTDGTVNAWQVNANLDIFSRIICFQLGGSSSRELIPDITCLDFVRTIEGKPDSNPHEVFVVGSRSGQLILCNINAANPVAGTDMIDPVINNFEPHQSCVLAVAFSNQRPGIFASISTDSELRVYLVEQPTPMKVICMDEALSCLGWVSNNPSLTIVGLGKMNETGEMLAIYNILSGKRQLIDGLSLVQEKFEISKTRSTTSMAINSSSTNRVAMGDNEGKVLVWDIPVRSMKPIGEEDLF